MNIQPVLFTAEEEEKQESRGPGLFVPIRAGALLVRFPACGEKGKHLPTGDCEQGELPTSLASTRSEGWL